MKKILATMLALISLNAIALDYTYSTNLFYAIGTVTNVYIGTNGADTTRDSAQTAWNKVNDNDNYLLRSHADLNLRFTNFVATNVATGGGAGGSAGSLWNVSATLDVYPNGSTGTNGGWSATATTIYPQ